MIGDMMEEKKKTLRDAIEEKTGVMSTPTQETHYHTLIAGKFPIGSWKEWKKNCKVNFNDIYWHKVWTDHIKAQAYDSLIGSVVQGKEIIEEDKKEE